VKEPDQYDLIGRTTIECDVLEVSQAKGANPGSEFISRSSEFRKSDEQLGHRLSFTQEFCSDGEILVG
jgi:hypothetical protein